MLSINLVVVVVVVVVAIKGFQALGRGTLSPGINYRGPVKEHSQSWFER